MVIWGITRNENISVFCLKSEDSNNSSFLAPCSLALAASLCSSTCSFRRAPGEEGCVSRRDASPGESRPVSRMLRIHGQKFWDVLNSEL